MYDKKVAFKRYAIAKIIFDFLKTNFRLQIYKFTLDKIKFVPTEKYVPAKNTFCSMDIDKVTEKRIFTIMYWPFKLPPN